MRTLAIETSCDETSASVVEYRDGKFKVLSLVVRSQVEHERFGGVVPEIAARAHIEYIYRVVKKSLIDSGLSLKDMDVFSATKGPGLAASLIVGLEFSKTLALVEKKPFIGVNHMIGHIYSAYLSSDIKPPFMCLIVSGGHTDLVIVKGWYEFEHIGWTLDDAAGEAFDKGARMLGLGYPGGAKIDRLAREGNKDFYKFPKVKVKQRGYFFSFSGLKTALLNLINEEGEKWVKENLPHIAASYQEAIINTIVPTTLKALKDFNINKLAVVGGVALNSRLREVLREKLGDNVIFSLPQYCTDNAAMIGAAGIMKFLIFGEDSQDISVYPSLGVIEK
ncbi:MAG: tRNA (adenosine(37)-N6)-threonylcarbamoyltransferase complex transferase subunit TsaD [candidate division WOR-3 bacterium]